MKTKIKKLLQNKFVLVVIFLILSIFVWRFMTIDKSLYPVLPDFSTIPECSPSPLFSGESKISCQTKLGATFDLIKLGGEADSSCKFPLWGGCFVKDVFYDKKYIKRMEDRLEGSGCNVTRIYRFKGIKKGYTRIIFTNNCSNPNKEYKIFIR